MALSVEKQKFITDISYYVWKYAYLYGIDAHSPIIAQAILESGWGESKLAAKYHNYFGLKCGTKWNGKRVNMKTMEEYSPGTFTEISDDFRAYDSMDAGVKGYFEFIQLPRYQNLRGIRDPKKYLETIKADGYATASSYVASVYALITQYNLTKYDKMGEIQMTKTEKAIQQMEAWARDDSHGYDQIYRWGEKGDYDCSASVIQAWENAGVPVKTRGATYTGNMYAVFTGIGFKDVTGKINLVTGSGLQRGDVLLNHVNHVAMFCGNGMEVEASINEKGTATGGQPGDQTGKEFLIRSYRNYPWDCVLRYPEQNSSGNGNQTVSADQAKMNTVDYVARMTKDTKCYLGAGAGSGQSKMFPLLKKGAVVDVMKYTENDNTGKKWYFIRVPHPTEGFVFEFVPGGCFQMVK